jgi:DNA damage-binding protein 1
MAHDAKGSEEMHQSEGGFLKPIIFGGLDGILTSFAIVAGSAGGNLPTGVVLILGFSNIFADALSMGVGEFLSSKAENEWILSERRREEWEFENYPDGEVREMVEIFEERGMTHEDAELVITTMAKYKDFFVDIMMTQELQLQVPETDHVRESFNEGACSFCRDMCFSHAFLQITCSLQLSTLCCRSGIVMFLSFATFGAFPILGYVIFPAFFPLANPDQLFRAACSVTGIVLFFLGSLKSIFR